MKHVIATCHTCNVTWNLDCDPDPCTCSVDESFDSHTVKVVEVPTSDRLGSFNLAEFVSRL